MDGWDEQRDALKRLETQDPIRALLICKPGCETTARHATSIAEHLHRRGIHVFGGIMLPSSVFDDSRATLCSVVLSVFLSPLSTEELSCRCSIDFFRPGSLSVHHFVSPLLSTEPNNLHFPHIQSIMTLIPNRSESPPAEQLSTPPLSEWTSLSYPDRLIRQNKVVRWERGWQPVGFPLLLPTVCMG